MNVVELKVKIRNYGMGISIYTLYNLEGFEEWIKGYLSCTFSRWPGSRSGYGSGRKITQGIVQNRHT